MLVQNHYWARAHQESLNLHSSQSAVAANVSTATIHSLQAWPSFIVLEHFLPRVLLNEDLATEQIMFTSNLIGDMMWGRE